jgi:hypothetical protein
VAFRTRDCPVKSSRLIKTEGIVVHIVKFTHWEEDGAWIGYLEEFPDYWTQGETLDDLKEHLLDLYRDLTSGQIPGIRKVAELVV